MSSLPRLNVMMATGSTSRRDLPPIFGSVLIVDFEIAFTALVVGEVGEFGEERIDVVTQAFPVLSFPNGFCLGFAEKCRIISLVLGQ